jgi:serine/threonine-protein kinase
VTQEQLEEFARARLGTTLQEKWTLDNLLGVGGTASVYAARHKNGKRVAVKILHPELSRHEHFRERFLREAYVGNRISHPGAITVSDNDVTEDGCAFLVMDLLEGENLEVRRERKGGVLDALEVLSLMDATLDTLHAAHGKGIVHRDIKPENLFLTVDNQLRLLDFGIAHINVPQNPGQTLAGVSMGTPAFMPPEQASAHWDKVDAQSDLWAVGASMFTLLTGRYVHQGGTVNESLVLAVTKPAPRIEAVNPRVPSNVATIVNKALERDKGKRYQTAEQMQREIRVAFQALQSGDTPEQDRYSLSDGRVAKHSLPPRVLALPWSPASLEAPAEPAAEPEEPIDRKSFRPGPDRRWLLLAAVLLGLGGLAALLLAGSPEEPTAARATDPQAKRPATTAAATNWSDFKKTMDTEPPAATATDPSTLPPAPAESDSEQSDANETSKGNGEVRLRGGRRAYPPRSATDVPHGETGSSPSPGADFDPLAERQ